MFAFIQPCCVGFHVTVSLCFHPFDKYEYNVTPQWPTSTNVLSYTTSILLLDPLPPVFSLFTLAKFLAMMHDILLRVYGRAQLLPRSLLGKWPRHEK